MISRLSFFVLGMIALGVSGCNYVYLPLSQCRQDKDCSTGSRCYASQCTTKPLGGTNSVCQSTAECQIALECLQNLCRPVGSEPTAEVGQEKPTEGKGEGTSEAQVEGLEKPREGDGSDERVPDPSEIRPESFPEVEPEIPTEAGIPPALCTPGEIRSCRLKSNSFEDPSLCGKGQETCLFDGTWDACKYISLPKGWITHDKIERCNERDDNCDGYIDEGCPDEYSCKAFYHIPYGDPIEHIAFAETNGEYAYSPDRQLAVYLEHTTKPEFKVARLDFRTPTTDPDGLKKEWLLTLPLAPSGRYAINRQGTLIASFSASSLYLWRLNYDAQGKPFLQASHKVAATEPSFLGFVGDGRDLVGVRTSYDSVKRESTLHLALWRVLFQADGSIQVQSRQDIAFPKTHLETYGAPHLPVRKDGKVFALASYHEVLLFEAPSLKLIKRITIPGPADPEYRTVAFHPTLPHLLIAPFNYASIFTLDLTLDGQGVPVGVKKDLYGWPSQSESPQRWGFHPQTGDLYASSNKGFYRWKSPTSGAISQPEYLRGQASAHALHPSGKFAAIGHNSGHLSLLATRDGKVLHQDPPASAGSYYYHFIHLAFSPDGKWLLSGERDELMIREVLLDPAGNPSLSKPLGLSNYTIPPGSGFVQGLVTSFSADSKTFGWAYGQAFEIYQESNGRFAKVESLTGHSHQIRALKLHPTLPFALSGSTDMQVRLWHRSATPTSTVLATFQRPVVGVFFYKDPGSNEEYALATSEDGKTYAWALTLNAQTGAQAKALKGEVSLPTNASALAIDYHEKPFFFAIQGDSFAFRTSAIQRRAFWISPPKADGSRDFRDNGSLRSLEQTEDIKSIRYVSGNPNLLYGFTASSIRLWYCPTFQP